MKLLMEVRPGEGGDDAKLLVNEQAGIYLRYAERVGLAVSLEDQDGL